MNDLKQKFVITSDELIAGRVIFHRELSDKAIAGGWWFYDKQEQTLYLYGTSFDYGQFSINQVNERIEDINLRFRNPEKIIFEMDPMLSIYDILKKYMDPYRAMDLVTNNDFI